MALPYKGTNPKKNQTPRSASRDTDKQFRLEQNRFKNSLVRDELIRMVEEDLDNWSFDQDS